MSSAPDAPARGGGSRRRSALWLCVLVAVVHGLAWTVVNPIAQGPDEPTHVIQVEALTRAFLGADRYDDQPGRPEVEALLDGLPWSAEHNPSYSPLQERLVRERLAELRWRGGGPGYAILNPPLFYFASAPINRVAVELPIVERWWLMRLVGVALFAATVALCFLFVREVIPRHPWTWTVGGLAVALQPVSGFMAGSVNPDNLLYVTTAALLLCLARGFRRGLTLALGVAIGLTAVAGALTKGTVFGLLPGAAVGCLLLGWEAVRGGRVRALLALPAGALVFVALFGGWLWINTNVFERPAATTAGGYRPPPDWVEYGRAIASYTWQVFFPRLPDMQDQYQNYFATNPPFPAFPQYPLWETWVEGFVGRFGWHQFDPPLWVDAPAAVIFVALGLLAARGVWRATGRLRTRKGELVTYTLMAVGAFMLVTVAGYGWRAANGGLSFEQMRYLQLLIPLYAAVVAAACVGAGRRGRALGAVLIVLASAHTLGSLMFALGRYYG